MIVPQLPVLGPLVTSCNEEPSWSTRRALLLAGLEQEREMPTRLKARAPAAPGL